MSDQNKPKEQLVKEVQELRAWVDALERERRRLYKELHYRQGALQDAPSVLRQQVPYPSSQPPLESVRVLCISNPTHAQEYAEICTELGHNPVVVTSLDELAKQQGHFELCLLDVNTRGHSPGTPPISADIMSGVYPDLCVERVLMLDILADPTGYHRCWSGSASNYGYLDFENGHLTEAGKRLLREQIIDTLMMPKFEHANYYDWVTTDFLHSVVESSQAPIMALNPEGRIVFANYAAQSFFRRPTHQLKDLPIEALLADQESVDVFWDLNDRIVRRLGGEAELRMRVRKGVEYDVLVLLNRIFHETLPSGYRGLTFQDITQRKNLLREQQSIKEQMFQAQKLESLGVLAGGIAHDFNNLLVGILGNASLALKHLDPESAGAERVEAIQVVAQRAAELTKQLLAYSGGGKFLVEPINLSQITEEMLNLLRISIGNNAFLQAQLAAELPLIEADKSQVQQVLMNLIVNAAEAVNKPNDVIRIATNNFDPEQPMIARALQSGDVPHHEFVVLEVSDTGCGMDAETQTKLFEPFYTTKQTGRGLGMAAVAGIVRGHGGHILIETKQGNGTTILVLLPIPREPLTPKSNTSETIPQILSGVAGTALVVDDEDTVREVATAILEEAGGWQVYAAASGAEAVKLYQTHHHELSLVLLDLTMPGMDGRETLVRLSAISSRVPVLFSSGYSAAQALNDIGANQQVAGFIEKPYRPLELLNKIQQIMLLQEQE